MSVLISTERSMKLIRGAISTECAGLPRATHSAFSLASQGIAERSTPADAFVVKQRKKTPEYKRRSVVVGALLP